MEAIYTAQGPRPIGPPAAFLLEDFPIGAERLTGMGFIGVGAIMKRGGQVPGVTTAATL